MNKNFFFEEIFKPSITVKKLCVRKKKLNKIKMLLLLQESGKINIPKVVSYINTIETFDAGTFEKHFRMSKNIFMVSKIVKVLCFQYF